MRANCSVLIHLVSHDAVEVPTPSYRYETDRNMVDIGDPLRVRRSFEAVIEDEVVAVKRRYATAA